VRLVFIKLFEQKVLMKMDKLFLDIINILKTVGAEVFVAEPYAPSAAFKPQFSVNHHQRADVLADAEGSANCSQNSETVELAIDS